MKTSTTQHNRGIALIIVLSFVVLVSAVVVAFLSRAQTNRQISAITGGGIQADSIAKSAVDTIVSDLQLEIEAGTPVANRITLADGSILYPPSSAAPQTAYPYRHSEVASIPNLAKISQAAPFYAGTGYITTNVPNRGAGLTSVVSGNNRSISPARWRAPQLSVNASGVIVDIPTPAWIYVTSKGDMGMNASSGSTLGENSTNILKVGEERPAVGRYAYAIYDVGGLLDINAAGNALPTSGVGGNQHRGRLHHADITGFTTASGTPVLINTTAFNNASSGLVNFRNPNSKADTGSVENEGGLFDPKRDFIKVNTTTGGFEQVFLTRQDLINYARAGNGGLTLDALPYLTVFTREKNAPVWNTTLSATTPDLPYSVTRKLKQRFPLGKLRLLADHLAGSASASAAEVQKYFGLTWDATDKVWVYGSKTAELSHIRTLAEIPENENPNFFEILKSIIAPDSLGAMPASGIHSPAGTLLSNNQKRKDAHVFQIGANIIDQFDTDNFPTDIFAKLSATGGVNSPENRFFGVENLPYVSRVGGIFQTRTVPASGGNPAQDLIEAWLQPEFFNPYGPIRSGGTDIRIRMLGQASLLINGTTAVTTELTSTGGGVGTFVGESVAAQTPNFGNPFSATESHAWFGTSVTTAPGTGGTLVASTPVPVGGSGTPTYSIEPGNGTGGTPLTIILEYNAATSGNPADYRPYAIWREVAAAPGAGTPSPARMSVAASNAAGSYTFNPALLPIWQKLGDPRTERQAVTFVAAASNAATAPTAPANATLYNNHIRGVGELGYAFRDVAATNIRLNEANSPDAALLDFFTVDDNEVIGGRMSLNSRSLPALKAVFMGTGIAANASSGGVDAARAANYANALIGVNNPIPSSSALINRGGLSRLLTEGGSLVFTPSDNHQAGVRAFAEVANARTWNLLIDVIAQSGRIPSGTADSALASTKFVVEGERRYWVHIAIDRYTGEEISTRIIEVVKE